MRLNGSAVSSGFAQTIGKQRSASFVITKASVLCKTLKCLQYLDKHPVVYYCTLEEVSDASICRRFLREWRPSERVSKSQSVYRSVVDTSDREGSMDLKVRLPAPRTIPELSKPKVPWGKGWSPSHTTASLQSSWAV